MQSPYKKTTHPVFLQNIPKSAKNTPKNTLYPHFYKYIKQMYICAFSQIKNLNVCCIAPRAGWPRVLFMFRTNFGRVLPTPSPYYNKLR